jgi:hypothetical protein
MCDYATVRSLSSISLHVGVPKDGQSRGRSWACFTSSAMLSLVACQNMVHACTICMYALMISITTLRLNLYFVMSLALRLGADNLTAMTYGKRA